MRIQLWSYNYAPEPTGIAPISAVWARETVRRGHEVTVVSAHPHYPAPVWDTGRLPYRETIDGVQLVRFPLIAGRATRGARVKQELSFIGGVTAGLPFLGRPDVMIMVSPSFPALAPAILNAKARRIPTILWLKDILPDGAVTTGLLDEESKLLKASRWLERTAYEHSDRIAVISESFARNLRGKGVLDEKLRLVYDPASRTPSGERNGAVADPPRVLSMGNIGHTQGLAPLVAAFERSADVEDLGVRLHITGEGVAAQGVRDEIGPGHTEMLGIVDDERLEHELRSASLALVSQSFEGTEFNLPSKLMNFMTYGLPVIAAVNPRSEVARIVTEAGAGWVVDSSEPERFPQAVRQALEQPDEMRRRGASGRDYAARNFSVESCVSGMERLAEEVLAGR